MEEATEYSDESRGCYKIYFISLSFFLSDLHPRLWRGWMHISERLTVVYEICV